MKKSLSQVIIVAMLLLSLGGCAPTEEAEPSPSPSEEVAQSPLPSAQAGLTAEEVLPPIEKNIFSSEWDEIYGCSVSAAPYGCAAILADGSLVAWGETMVGGSIELDENGYYQVSSFYDDLTYVSCAQFDTFIIDKDGTLLGWGMVWWWGNILGATDVMEPLRIMTDVQMASCVGRSYLALRKDGTVWMWGEGEYGVLGNGPEYTKYTIANPLLEPVKVLENVIYANIDDGRCYAIKEDNTLWVWGCMGWTPEPSEMVIYDRPVCIMEDVKCVSGNFAVKTDGTLWALNPNWQNMYDESGTPLFYGIEPVQIMEGVKLARGGSRFLVIKNDGSLWVWGDNYGGALGNGTDEYIDEPMKIMDDVVYVTSSIVNVYALKSNGELWEMGTHYGMFNYSSESGYIPTQEELFESRLPHKILDGVLVGGAS